MSGEVWYSVGKHDVFPETFGPFLLGNPRVREAFMRHHADLLDVDFWQRNKERIQRGEVIDFFPYGAHRRFDAVCPIKRKNLPEITSVNGSAEISEGSC